jgi:hypothetical protein
MINVPAGIENAVKLFTMGKKMNIVEGVGGERL